MNETDFGVINDDKMIGHDEILMNFLNIFDTMI